MDILEERAFSEGPVPIWSSTATQWMSGGHSRAGIAIDRYSILASAPVFRCIQIITGWIAKLPLEVFKTDGSIDDEHPAQWLLSHHPSNLYTPRDWKKTNVHHLLVHGQAINWIIRENGIDPSELIILNPECSGAAIANGKLIYYTRIGNDYQTLLPENILHFKGLSHDGINPYSVLDILADAFSTGIAAQRYANVFYKNDASPGVVLSFPTGVKVDTPQAEKIAESWEKTHGNIEHKHRIGIIGNGGQATFFQANHEATQFLQTREHEIACTVSNIFGIPKSWLGLDGATNGYNGLEQVHRGFLNNTLDDILVGIEEECERKLLRETQRIRANRYIEFDRRSLERADSKAYAETLVMLVNNGLMTENNALAELNHEGCGPEGDRMRMPTNIGFVDIIGSKKEPVTDIPNPVAEQVAGADDGSKEPIDVNPVDGNLPERFKALQAATINRLNTRLEKAYKASYEARENLDIESHIPVFVESSLFDKTTARKYITDWIINYDRK